MRVLIVDTYYPAFLAGHYARRPTLGREPYETQLRSLLDRSFGTGDAYSRGLRAAGHEAAEVIANCAPLQARWAREHGEHALLRRIAAQGGGRIVTRFQRELLPRIVHAQADELEADVVYVQDTGFLPRRDLERLRRAGRFVAGQLASPAPPLELLRGYDLIVSSFPHFVERFREQGLDSEYLPLAFDDAVLDRLRAMGVDPDPAAGRPHAATFVGGVDPAVHAAGTKLLERAVAEAGVEVWGYGAGALPRESAIRAHHHGEAWGLDMYAVLARSRTVVNRHIDVAEDFANNMRLFEATGAGAALLTDHKRNLGDLFEPGLEVATYHDADELVAKLRELREDDALRLALARAGRTRVLRDHTYTTRMAQLAAVLGDRVGR